MRRLVAWYLIGLALGVLALIAAGRIGLISPPSPKLLLGVAAGFVVLCLVHMTLRALPPRPRRIFAWGLTLVVIVVLVGGVSFFQFVLKPTIVKNAISAAFAPKPTAVAVVEPKEERWAPQLVAIGTLRAYQGVIVAPQVQGVVTARNFQSGDDVEAEAKLIELDTSVEQADLASGLAQLKNANVTLERARTLIASGNTPQSTVDAALAARDSAQAAVDRVRAVIAQKTIKAPFAGRLGLRNVDIGQYVAPGTPLTTLQQLDPIYVDFTAPEGALASLAVGEDTTLTVDALPGRAFAGKVTAIDARVSADSRNVVARAQFSNSERKLLPGMFANVTVVTGAPDHVLTLPRTAIVYSLYGDNAFVVVPAKTGDGLTVERRFIRLGETRGDRVAILDGVKPGDKVVSAGQIKLQQNSPVTIDENGALPPPAETPKP